MAATHSGVRQARPDDGAQVVPLLVEAIDHLALYLAGAADHAAAVPFFARLFEVGGNRYGREHVLVLEQGGEIAAAILGYPGRDVDRGRLRARGAGRPCARRSAGGRRQARREASLCETRLRRRRRAPAGRAPLRTHEPRAG